MPQPLPFNGSQPHHPEDTPNQTLYELLGPAVFHDLIHEFYTLMRADDLIGPMYPADDWEGAEQRLRWFFIQYWGGPAEFSTRRGHPRLRMRHARFVIGPAEAQRWVALMETAMQRFDTTVLPEQARQAIRDHAQRVATMLINQP